MLGVFALNNFDINMIKSRFTHFERIGHVFSAEADKFSLHRLLVSVSRYVKYCDENTTLPRSTFMVLTLPPNTPRLRTILRSFLLCYISLSNIPNTFPVDSFRKGFHVGSGVRFPSLDQTSEYDATGK